MNPRSIILTMGLAATHAMASPAGRLFSDNFETGLPKPGWSSNTVTAWNPTTTWFAGCFSGTTAITLQVPPAPPPETSGSSGGSGGGGSGGSAPRRLVYTLTFDLIAIDSWDGFDTRYGPDAFRVSANDRLVFEEYISNVNPQQTFRGHQPDVGIWHFIGSPIYGDSIYRRIEVPFELPIGESVTIRFHTSPLQGLEDESWGIDNVNLDYAYVPTPGTLVLGAAGLALVVRRRQR